MSTIILPSRWRRQPTRIVGIESSSIFAQNLVGAWLPAGNNLIDASGRIGALIGTGTVPVSTQKGIGHDLATAYLTNTSQSLATNVPLTFAVWINPDVLGVNGRIFDVSTGTTANDVIGIQLSAASDNLSAQHYDGSTNAPASYSITGRANQWLFVVGVFASLASRTLYINGAGVASNTTAVVAPSGIDRVTIGYDPWGGNEYFNGKIIAPMLWNRALSAGEIQSLYDNPWQVFKKSARILYFPSAGGGGATLTADSGSYALTGTAATLAVGRKLTAESGTYSVTGTSVDFLRGYSLTAESGGYSVSGTDAAIKLGRLLAAESGSYTLTGTEVTLTYQQAGSYSLTADAGSYALTGTAAALRVTRTLTAEAGSYSLAGTDVTLKRGYAVQADTGSYTLTGTAVAFARTYVLGAESGSYTLTGSDVGLTWSAAPVVETPTHGGPSIYGKAVFREKEFRREYDEQIRRIDEAKLAERLIREDEELIIIMAALAA